MKYHLRTFFTSFLLLSILVTAAQPQSYSVANAHSHNDYASIIPFYMAYNNKFGSIEADIYSVNDSLFVAHNRQDIKPGRTLRNLYLIPLLHALDSNARRELNLLVDIKDDYKISLALLLEELIPLRKYLSTPGKSKPITVTISGNRPPPAEYKNYPDYIFFDDDLKLPHTKDQWNRVSLVSLPLYRITRWNGKDKFDAGDSVSLKKLIDSVHLAGKPIRFWAAPDTELSWQMQMNVNVDLIGTDKINELADFLRKRMLQ